MGLFLTTFKAGSYGIHSCQPVFHCQPLPDSQYNGNPESVGYRVKYWRSDQPSSALAQVVSDRLERELTIEELEEWTEYELRMQAFNAIGAGPWSELVRGRTRESGEREVMQVWRQGPLCVSVEMVFVLQGLGI